MNIRQKQTGRATSMIQGLTTGAVFGIALTFIGALLLAKLIDQQIIPWEKVGYGIMAAILTASFGSAWLSYHKIKHRKLLVCLLSGGIYWLTLICITIVFYKGHFECVPVTTGIILAGSMGVFFLGLPAKKPHTSRKYRMEHR